MSIVRKNLMTEPGYSPYCGDTSCPGSMPRTRFNGDQFECTHCAWVSEFPPEFIEEYKAKWGMNLTSDKCPHCQSQDISGGPVTIEGRKAVQECDCNNCGKYFEAEYVLSAIRIKGD